MTHTLLQWFQAWFQSECNGDWEHGFGVYINTIDNPGWHVQIGLVDTELGGLEIDYNLEEGTENDWYNISIKENKYNAAGDPTKLEFLLENFRALVESSRKQQLTEYLNATFPGRWRT